MANSLKASARGLEIVDRARKKKGWTKKAPIWCQTALTAEATLKRFWSGHRINRETFIKICEAVDISNWQEIADMGALTDVYAVPKQDWGEAPDVCGFFGRGEELSQLEEWIVNDNNCRVVALYGIAGIGKTYLVKTLTSHIHDEFDYLFWRSLRQVPLVENILADLWQFFYPDREFDISQSFNETVSELIQFLRNNRCLIVLDDFDAVLQSGDRTGSYLEGYEGYGELLKRLAETSTKSCLVLIGREKPREIAAKERKASPVRSHQLLGLQLSEAGEILLAKDLIFDKDDWEQLINIYRGHPLALQVVSSIIQELYDCSVTAFLKQKTIFLGDINLLLSQQFKRLSNLEKEVIYWICLNRLPVSIFQLQMYTASLETSPLLEVLTSLGWRSLIERTTDNDEVLFLLQPMVMKYVTTEFVERICNEVYQKNLELLRSHPLVLQYEVEGRKTEFPYRSTILMVKDRLIKQFGSKSILIERLNDILSILKNNPAIETGYAKVNIYNLLEELNQNTQSTMFLSCGLK
ncbi:MAG: NB-ARC domain-containing protein [Scytonema sp. PMC 1069.18]|nr:NB-ARC domain-containing protein [Scytonema sp. PMC 1069.18]MEC4882487.1 NB-ARC domain-containing protein [Scytonema sp. PMC 1070.18]